MDPFQLDDDTYAHLRALANLIHNERSGNRETIQPTMLLHEAWMKVGNNKYASRAHFMAVAARAMRQILVDRARARQSQKRGGDLKRTTMAGVGADASVNIDVLALHEALEKLEAADPESARIALMHTFGGMTAEEIAEALNISKRSVWRSWRFSRAFLQRLMSDSQTES